MEHQQARWESDGDAMVVPYYGVQHADDIEEPPPPSAPLLTNSSSSSTDASCPSAPKKPRLQSLDVFRGVTMLGMILVDNQGNFDHVVRPLDESIWDGIRPSDCVFPFFLFIAGFAVALAMNGFWDKIPDRRGKIKAWARVLQRIGTLFVVGLLLNAFGSNPWDKWPHWHFRIMGVLQRIALCYGTVTVLFLATSTIVQRVVMLCFTAIYVGLMYGLDVPKCGRGNLTPGCNAGGFIDRSIFGDWMIRPNDPEGLLSTLTATLTCYLGLEFGRILHKYRANQLELVCRWVMLALGLIGLALFLWLWMPINKKMWSVPFALMMGGIGGLVIFICYYLVDMVLASWQEDSAWKKACNAAIQPLIWMGMNPLAIFVLMIFLEILLLDTIHWNGDNLWNRIYWDVFQSWIVQKELASLVVSFVHVGLWVLFAWGMYTKKWFIKA